MRRATHIVICMTVVIVPSLVGRVVGVVAIHVGWVYRKDEEVVEESEWGTSKIWGASKYCAKNRSIVSRSYARAQD